MNELTQLEKEVMTAVLSTLIDDQGKVLDVVRSLPVSDRTFSRDVTDSRRCSGFYLNFKPNNLLAGTPNVPHHLSVYGTHADTPAGGDFILFFSQDRAGIDYLEGTFFDHTLPIDKLLANNHGFALPPT